MTLRKHVTKSKKNMRKWTVEFLRKFESYGDKIAIVNTQFESTNLSIYLYFDGGRFFVHSPFIDKSKIRAIQRLTKP